MPLGPTGHYFFQENKGGVFARKLVDSIYSGPRNEREIIIKKKKKLG